MFNRVTDIATGTADLFRAEGELLIERSRRLLSYGVLMAVAGTIAGISLLGLAVAGGAALASLIGWVAALTVAGTVGLSLSLVVLVLARQRTSEIIRRDELPRDPRARAEEARARISDGDTRDTQQNSSHANTSTTSEKSGDDDSGSIADRVAEYVVSNPGASVAGISAAMAVLGPGKTLKYAGRAMMLAKLAKKMVEHATDDSPRPAAQGQDSRASAAREQHRSHTSAPTAPTAPTAPAGRPTRARHHHAPTSGQR